MYKIKKASEMHINDIAQLAHLLWPDEDKRILQKEMQHYQTDSTAELFVCEAENQLVGFAHVQLRYDYVEGTTTSPVGYLEGIYVKESHRTRGIGKQLVEVCEDWARFMDATEFGSDIEIENEISAYFHESLGFNEINRIICYAKKL